MKHPFPSLTWDEQKHLVSLASADGTRLELPAAGLALEFEQHRQAEFLPGDFTALPDGVQFRGTVPGSALSWQVRWRVADNGCCYKQAVLEGAPPVAWGSFRRLYVMEQPLPAENWDDQMGWREQSMEARDAGESRPTEEGAGRLPSCGYPVFGERLFAGLEHPMGFNRVRSGSLELFHHPNWSQGRLESFPAVIGFCRKGEPVAAAFQRYLATIRRPLPARAIVEVNTFWTDPFGPDATGRGRYTVSQEGYLGLVKEWTDRVLQGQQGLLTSFMLDAGWQEISSAYRPQASVGGPGDEWLAELGEFMRERGVKLGLWWSWNGPIGIDDRWAEARGFRVSNRGDGATYGTAGGKMRYECFTDPNWEAAIGGRLEELLTSLPVMCLKEDWVNVGIIDPARFPGQFTCVEQMWEANVDVMIRLGRRALAKQPDLYWRGGQWPSPWWLMHHDCLHLANSGDCEASDLPALTQRDAIMTARDALLYHHAVTCRTPVAWDSWTLHEFAAAPRNPVQDTDESWLNNLMLWISRGTHHLTIYMPPYDLYGWRAWSLRETLRWLRAEEDLLWKCSTRMVGGDPRHGAVYGFLHEDGERRLLTLRNPLGVPQAVPSPESLGISSEDWSRIYPVWEPWDWQQSWMPSNAVWVLTQGDARWRTGQPRLRCETGWAVPFGQEALDAVPDVHRMGGFRARLERLDERQFAIRADIPFGLRQLEWVIASSAPADQPPVLRAALGRYPDGLSTAPLPVTWMRSHWRVGYGQGRLGWLPHDQTLWIARVPGATAGASHLFLRAETPLPDPTQVWAEWQEQSLPAGPGDQDNTLVPPSLPNCSHAVCVYPTN